MHWNREVQIAALITHKALVTILVEYSDFANVFSKKSAVVLPKHTKINTHTLNLEKSKKQSYRLIYSLGPVELETLKTYIKTNLANSFICLSQSSTGASILIDKKPNESFGLCINYKSLNNINIKNHYPFLLVSEFFNCLGCVKQFI